MLAQPPWSLMQRFHEQIDAKISSQTSPPALHLYPNISPIQRLTSSLLWLRKLRLHQYRLALLPSMLARLGELPSLPNRQIGTAESTRDLLLTSEAIRLPFRRDMTLAALRAMASATNPTCPRETAYFPHLQTLSARARMSSSPRNLRRHLVQAYLREKPPLSLRPLFPRGDRRSSH